MKARNNNGKNMFILYSLIDPRDLNVFYVGKSCSGHSKMIRHLQSWSLKGSNKAKNSLIKEIIKSGAMPILKVISEYPNKVLLERAERKAIRAYGKVFKLTNIQGNR